MTTDSLMFSSSLMDARRAFVHARKNLEIETLNEMERLAMQNDLDSFCITETDCLLRMNPDADTEISETLEDKFDELREILHAYVGTEGTHCWHHERRWI